MLFAIGFILGMIVAAAVTTWLYAYGFHYALAKGWVR